MSMRALVDKKEQAIELRKQGKTYREIREIVPVSKSSLSLWLRSVGMAKRQHQTYSIKKQIAQAKGAATSRAMRIRRSQEVILLSKIHLNNMNLERDTLFMFGVALYWAEGSKEKSHKVGSGVTFSNSDPRMVRLFVYWLYECAHVAEENIRIDIYVHETCLHSFDELKTYWQENVGYNSISFGTIYLKKHKLSLNRRNVGRDYYGLVRVSVKKSSALNRKIVGWIEGFCEKYTFGE